jgi:hypothetical protein
MARYTTLGYSLDVENVLCDGQFHIRNCDFESLSIFDKSCSAWWISARLRSPSSSPSSFFIYNLTSRSQFNSTATNTTRRPSNETDESLFRTVILGCLGREITVVVSLVNCVASVVYYEVCSPEDTEVMVVVGTLLLVAKITQVQPGWESLLPVLSIEKQLNCPGLTSMQTAFASTSIR